MNIKTTTHFEAPLPAVFSAFSEIDKAAERIHGIKRIEMLTDGPMRVGTRWRETRVMFKRDATEELEVTAFEPQRHYRVECESCGCTYETYFRFRSNGTGTDVEMEMRARPVSLFARLMSPLGKLMAGSVKKLVQQDFEDMRKFLERASH